MNEYDFQKWDSIGRLNRPILVTEKIDGTNSQILVEDRELAEADSKERAYEGVPELPWIYQDDFALLAGSRKRYLSEGNDNFGFYQWVKRNAGHLLYLGPGRHYGEWWGKGIQRGYGQTTQIFSLFNVMRYALDFDLYKPLWDIGVRIVPLMYAGDWNPGLITACLVDLDVNGSKAAPGFMDAEGIVVFHTANNALFKITLKGDQHKQGFAPPIYEKIAKLKEAIRCENQDAK